jgi:bifunctional non-homologous end joining protein LigD
MHAPDVLRVPFSSPDWLYEIKYDGYRCLAGIEDGRAKKRGWYKGCDPVTLCAFDILVHNGLPVMGLSLVERKALLQQLVAPVNKKGVLLVDYIDADASVFKAMVLAGWGIEGVMAKRRASIYRPGVRSEDWLKIKRLGWQEGRRWTNR